MKAFLRISLLINLVLLTVVFQMTNHRRSEIRPATAVNELQVRTEIPAPAMPAPQAVPASQPARFNWSQLEAPDYPTYIANLRGIGCPEATVSDIISADVEAGIFARRRAQLKNERTDQANESATAIFARHRWEEAARQLENEKATMLATLLGTPLLPSQAKPNAVMLSRAARAVAKEVPIALPLVFQSVDLSVWKPDTNRLNLITCLRQKFIDEIGGPNQDPNDPVYRERWQKAQSIMNSQLQGMLGLNAYHTYEELARRAAHSPAGAAEQP